MSTTLEKPKRHGVTGPSQRRTVRHHPIVRAEQMPGRYQPTKRADDAQEARPLRRLRTLPTDSTVATEPMEARRQTLARRSALNRFFRTFTLEKSFTLLGFAVGTVLSILFAIDMLVAWPFMRASSAMDVTFVLSGLTMLALSWSVAQDQIHGRRPPGRISPVLLKQ